MHFCDFNFRTHLFAHYFKEYPLKRSALRFDSCFPELPMRIVSTARSWINLHYPLINGPCSQPLTCGAFYLFLRWGCRNDYLNKRKKITVWVMVLFAPNCHQLQSHFSSDGIWFRQLVSPSSFWAARCLWWTACVGVSVKSFSKKSVEKEYSISSAISNYHWTINHVRLKLSLSTRRGGKHCR